MRNIDVFYTELPHIEYRSFLSEKKCILDEKEIARLDKFRFEKDKKSFLISHVLLRQVLADYVQQQPTEISFSENNYGKPFLSGVNGSEIEFNLSHTEKYVCCCVTNTFPIGIDVEMIKDMDDCLLIASNYFSENEVCDLKSQDPKSQNRYFFKLWTLKEAFIKANGLGLSMPLDSFEFNIDTNRDIFFRYTDLETTSINSKSDEKKNQSEWFFDQIELESDCFLAVAAKKRVDEQIKINYNQIDF